MLLGKLIENYKLKMESWKGKWMSLVGEILMVKGVFSEIPVYLMSCLKLPTLVEESLN